MDPEAIRAFARRNWRALEDLEDAERQRRFDRSGAEASVARSRAVWAHVRAVRNDWPDPRSRRVDLEAHVALKKKLDRAAHAFPIR